MQVDRDRAADVGVEVEGVGRTMETMLGGRQVTRFKQNGEQYDVIVQMAPADRTHAERHLATSSCAAATDAMVPLSSLVAVREGVAPRELNHFQQLRSATDHGEPGAGLHRSARRSAYLERRPRVLLPETAQIDYSGHSREFRTSSADLYFTFLLALVFIYLVLAAQFESFVDPFIIMLTVPLSMTGALLALKLSGGTLNVYSQIGLVTLVGLITKHGILIVEFANQLRTKGRSVREAVHRGGGAAAAADPDDHRRDGARRGAAGAGARRRRGEPPADRLGDRRWHPARHVAHPVRGADGLQPARPPPPTARGGGGAAARSARPEAVG